MAHTELTLKERRVVARMYEEKRRIVEIAQAISRHRSTIYRELQRNSVRFDDEPYLNGYDHTNAHGYAQVRRARRRKLVRDPDLCAAVVDRLKAGWSPEQISGRLKLEGGSARLCHETIYAHVFSKDGQTAELARYLPSRRKRRQPRYARKPRDRVFPQDRSIHRRPEEINTRQRFGHWEGDLMIFQPRHGDANGLSLVERKTRFAVLVRNNDRKARAMANTMINALSPLPLDARQSITFDRLLRSTAAWSSPRGASWAQAWGLRHGD